MNCLAAMKVHQAIRTRLVCLCDFVVLFEHAPLVLGSFMHDGSTYAKFCMIGCL